MASESPPARRRDSAIDLLRAASILYVVGYWHLLGYVDGPDGYKNTLTIRLTLVILALFMMLSGHLIAYAPITSASALWSFLKRRFVRIVPPYLLALVLFHAIGLTTNEQLTNGLFLISSFTIDPPITLWFVSILVVFYVIAPVLQYLASLVAHPAQRWRLNRLAIVLLVSLLSVFVGLQLQDFMDQRLFLYFPPFLAGLLLVAPRPGSPASATEIILLVLATLGSIVYSFPHHSGVDSIFNTLPLAVFAPLMIIQITRLLYRGEGSLAAIAIISSASYFMYLFHRPVFELLRAGPFPTQPHWQIAYLLLIGMPMVIGLSWQGQKFYDRAVNRLLPSSRTTEARG